MLPGYDARYKIYNFDYYLYFPFLHILSYSKYLLSRITRKASLQQKKKTQGKKDDPPVEYYQF